MRFGIPLLIVGALTFPRIPLGIALPGRMFDLRIEDLLLALFTVMWILQLMVGRRLARTPLTKPILLYVCIAFFTTMVALALLDLNLSRALLYLVKEGEYFLIFFLTINWVRTDTEVRVAITALVWAGIANVAWFSVQLLTGVRQMLFSIATPLQHDVFIGVSRGESYGPQLIGESSPFAAGSVFMFLFLLSFSGLLYEDRRLAQRFGVLALVALVCVVLTLSRASFLGAVLGASVLLIHNSRRRRPRKAVIFAVAAGVTAVIYAGVDLLDRLSGENVSRAIGERTTDIWAPLFQAALDRPLLGYGKGSLGLLPGLGAGEAHNSYLRLFVEGGVFELLAFLWVVCAAAAVYLRVLGKATTPRSRTLAGAAVASVVAMMFAALLQDAFVPVLANEMLWLLLGLAWCAYRAEWIPSPVITAAAPYRRTAARL